jgi:hypothetical protein
LRAPTFQTLRCRPIDRLIEEQTVRAPLPASTPDRVLRVPADPYLRFDTCEYSLHPAFVGRRIEARVTDPEVLAIMLDTGELASTPGRSPSTARSARSSTPAHGGQAAARTMTPTRRSRSGRSPLRPADRVSRPTSELTHLFRQLKAPAAARALPKLADPGHPRLSRRPTRPLQNRAGGVALLADRQRHGRLDHELDKLHACRY